MDEQVNVAMYISRQCLVVPIQVELYDSQIRQLQSDVLKKVADSGIRGVVVDISGIIVLDSFLANSIFEIAKMASLLGVGTVVTGMRPEAVSSLVDMDVEPGDVSMAINLEEGLRLLDPFVDSKT